MPKIPRVSPSVDTNKILALVMKRIQETKQITPDVAKDVLSIEPQNIEKYSRLLRFSPEGEVLPENVPYDLAMRRILENPSEYSPTLMRNVPQPPPAKHLRMEPEGPVYSKMVFEQPPVGGMRDEFRDKVDELLSKYIEGHPGVLKSGEQTEARSQTMSNLKKLISSESSVSEQLKQELGTAVHKTAAEDALFNIAKMMVPEKLSVKNYFNAMMTKRPPKEMEKFKDNPKKVFREMLNMYDSSPEAMKKRYPQMYNFVNRVVEYFDQLGE